MYNCIYAYAIDLKIRARRSPLMRQLALASAVAVLSKAVRHGLLAEAAEGTQQTVSSAEVAAANASHVQLFGFYAAGQPIAPQHGIANWRTVGGHGVCSFRSFNRGFLETCTVASRTRIFISQLCYDGALGRPNGARDRQENPNSLTNHRA